MGIKVRLYSKGGTVNDDMIEDLDLVALPDVSDIISLEYGRGHENDFRVLSRTFHVLCAEDETKNEFDIVALEVEVV